jgi:hypothetical protein
MDRDGEIEKVQEREDGDIEKGITTLAYRESKEGRR